MSVERAISSVSQCFVLSLPHNFLRMAGVNSKTKRKEWDSEHMAEAIKLVREKKMGYLRAAKHFDVPRSTLFRLCRKNELSPEEAAATTLGRKTVLGTTLENLLVDYILTMESKFPHTTHKLQPLDKTLMAPLKTYYSEEIRMWIRDNNRPLSPYDVVELFGRAYLKVQTGEIAANGFRVTGLWPLNKNIFTAVDYLAAQQDAVKDGCTVNVTPITSCAQPLRQSMANFGTPDDCLPLTEASTPRQDTNIEPVPSTSGLSRSNLGLVSPYDISPVPNKKRKSSNRGRKASVAAVITSSPYKNELIEKSKKKEEKENKLAKNKNQKQNEKKSKGKKPKEKIKPMSDSDDDEMMLFDTDSEPDALIGNTAPDSEDSECIFCGMLFSDDSHGETWVKCLMCGLWAHNDCAGPESDAWICDFCK